MNFGAMGGGPVSTQKQVDPRKDIEQGIQEYAEGKEINDEHKVRSEQLIEDFENSEKVLVGALTNKLPWAREIISKLCKDVWDQEYTPSEIHVFARLKLIDDLLIKKANFKDKVYGGEYSLFGRAGIHNWPFHQQAHFQDNGEIALNMTVAIKRYLEALQNLSEDEIEKTNELTWQFKL